MFGARGFLVTAAIAAVVLMAGCGGGSTPLSPSPSTAPPTTATQPKPPKALQESPKQFFVKVDNVCAHAVRVSAAETAPGNQAGVPEATVRLEDSDRRLAALHAVYRGVSRLQPPASIDTEYQQKFLTPYKVVVDAARFVNKEAHSVANGHGRILVGGKASTFARTLKPNEQQLNRYAGHHVLPDCRVSAPQRHRSG